ncbi:hypothetical protein RhiirA5_433673 [Rhizophagus irregularis]|uniref:Uncharacterized protein n=1 Tax=Rhizophagus irregularis TaxID=588596 RepID=A0A2N0NRD4_9GLOM|nr:hypothetical protein RhiirA5_433673 [Rhizophagus irregularis]
MSSSRRNLGKLLFKYKNGYRCNKISEIEKGKGVTMVGKKRKREDQLDVSTEISLEDDDLQNEDKDDKDDQSTTFENINKGSEVEEVNPENININSDLHRELSNVKAHNLSLWSSNAMLHVLSTTELNDTTMDQAPHESPNAELNVMTIHSRITLTYFQEGK